MPALVLASASPRRFHLLATLGHRFEVCPADVDERGRAGEAPEALAERLAGAKAEAVAVRLGARAADTLILAADTVVVLDGRALGKPADEAENRAFLERLSGREHAVVTGHHLRRGGRRQADAVRTRVRVATLAPEEIARYVASGEGLDKAGGYGLQGRGAALIDGIDGCWSNVVGLSLRAVVRGAAQLGAPLV